MLLHMKYNMVDKLINYKILVIMSFHSPGSFPSIYNKNYIGICLFVMLTPWSLSLFPFIPSLHVYVYYFFLLSKESTSLLIFISITLQKRTTLCLFKRTKKDTIYIIMYLLPHFKSPRTILGMLLLFLFNIRGN